jgi:putative hydrolase of the HAD superfamily
MNLTGVLQIEVVFFDAAGTLFEVRGSVGEIYSRFARPYGVEAQPEAIQQGFIHNFRNQPPLAFPVNTPEAELKRLEYGWWRDLVKAVFAGYDFPRFDQFFAEVFEFFRSREAWVVFDDVVPTLEALKSRGLRLGVISNFDSRLFDLLQALGLSRFFDSVDISARVGAAKPDPAIFRAALGHYPIEPSQAAHVGDSLREDVAGARAAGLCAFLIDRRGEQHSAAGCASLSSLLQVLEMF